MSGLFRVCVVVETKIEHDEEYANHVIPVHLYPKKPMHDVPTVYANTTLYDISCASLWIESYQFHSSSSSSEQ